MIILAVAKGKFIYLLVADPGKRLGWGPDELSCPELLVHKLSRNTFLPLQLQATFICLQTGEYITR